MKVYAVGIGPGARECMTGEAVRAVEESDVVIGYGHTLKAMGGLLDGKEVITVTMSSQEEAYQEARRRGSGTLLVPFAGDASFSESEVVDRLVDVFGDVTVVPGVSSVQAAAARAGMPLDRARVITMHVTGDIEEKKLDMLKALIDGLGVVLVPRPWPSDPSRNFMPSEAARYLRLRGLDTSRIEARVYESLTFPDETAFEGAVDALEGREFSPLCVAVLGRPEPDSYMNYRWQWDA